MNIRFCTFLTVVSLVLEVLLVGAASAGRLASNTNFDDRDIDKSLGHPETWIIAYNQKNRPYTYYEAKGLFETGLQPVFPDGVYCPPISSPYGSQTRYDGSFRKNPWYGYHNGMDISLEPGTPLISVADAKVIHKGSAGRLIGNYIWLHLAPDATELPIHIFTRYQHLDKPSPLNIGDTVKAGDDIGSAGATGTTGGHFGAFRYSHLHLVFYTGPNADVTPYRHYLKPRTLNYLDPMGLYLDKSLGIVTNRGLRNLPSNKKIVPVSVRKTDGNMVPEGSKLIWPVACQ